MSSSSKIRFSRGARPNDIIPVLIEGEKSYVQLNFDIDEEEPNAADVVADVISDVVELNSHSENDETLTPSTPLSVDEIPQPATSQHIIALQHK